MVEAQLLNSYVPIGNIVPLPPYQAMNNIDLQYTEHVLKTYKMAAKKALVFERYTDVSESGGFVEGKCSVCNIKIRGKSGVTSNFVTHLKVCVPGVCV